MRQKLLLLLIFLSFSDFIRAQDMVSGIKLSQKSVLTQRIGTTDITVTYHSPQVNGRKIFGGLVPYDFVIDGKEYAWRAGSNNRTTVEFTHDVRVEGKPLPKGKYGLVVLVSKKEWTFVFSSNMTWGAFQYDRANDVLRVTVPVEKVSFQEWLSYDFIDREAISGKLALRWEKSQAAVKIEVEVKANIIADTEAKTDKEFSDYLTLAQYKRDLQLIDAEGQLALAEQALRAEENFQTKIYKADVLLELGRTAEGNALKEEALAMAEGFNMYYYGLSKILLQNNQKEAHKLLTDYAKKKPNDWIAHLALGEYYIKTGNQKKVVAHMKLAFENAPDNWRNYARYLYLQNKLILER